MLRDNLKATNSLTKYPSIPTYHALGERGRVTDTVQVSFTDDVLVTEKIDGTNARIIACGTDYLIGSREELLHARGDCIWNPSMGIVDALRPVAERLIQAEDSPDQVLVLYGEVYGGKVTAASKAYTSTGAVGFRVFDAAVFERAAFVAMAAWDPAHIAAWRDGGGQSFWGWSAVEGLCNAIDVRMVPALAHLNALPTEPTATLSWMHDLLSQTQAGIDAAGRPEGVVVRTMDRGKIAKIRFEDYGRGGKR